MKSKGVFISDFTIDNLVNLFKTKSINDNFEILETPTVPVISYLLGQTESYWKELDFCVIWTQPQAIISEFSRTLRLEKVPIEELYQSVDDYTNLLKSVAKKTGIVLVPTWTINPNHRGLGVGDLKVHGLAKTIMSLNSRISDNLENENKIFLLDANRWINLVGPKAYNSKLWYRAKILFSVDVFKEAQKDIVAAIRVIKGNTKKILFVDLDNTLWGGIVGDDGWENLNLGGHNEIGEAFIDFQKSILNLKKRGVILAIVSKNEENVALHAIDKHPEMILKKSDFSSWRINWDDKAINIIDILNELNLGQESAVFLDDSPVERSRVKEALSEVYVPELPINVMNYNNFLLSLDCFDSVTKTNEDFMRAGMYDQELERKSSKDTFVNKSDWIKGLSILIKSESLSAENLKRCVQLLNKTNQMNLSTRRFLETDYLEWSKDKNSTVLTLSVYDKYGNYGLTGILGMKLIGSSLHVIDYVLSCRVMGRDVEEAMIYITYNYAVKIKAKYIHFSFTKTKKNNPCYIFFQKSGLSFNKDRDLFSWDMSQEYPKVQSVSMELNGC